MVLHDLIGLTEKFKHKLISQKDQKMIGAALTFEQHTSWMGGSLVYTNIYTTIKRVYAEEFKMMIEQV